MTSRPSEPGALLAALAWAAGTWVALGAVALTTPDTSARAGVLPPFWLLAALAVAASLVVVALRVRTSDAAPLFLALVAFLPWLPVRVPAGFLLFDGPLGVVVSAAGAAAAVWPTLRVRVPRVAMSPRGHLAAAGVVAAVLYGGAAWRMAPVIPGGDEPHYLVITQSLLLDGDLRIENNHQRRDYLAYADADLKPDFLRRGQDGEIYSIHAPGLAVLVLPAFAAGGYPGVVIFLALLSAAGSLPAWRAAYALTRDARAAWVGWAAVALTVPFFFQAFTVYPDGPAALLVMVAVAGLVEDDGSGRGPRWPAGFALALLPWLHTRYVLLTFAAGLVLAARVIWPPGGSRTTGIGARAKALVALAAMPTVSLGLWLGFFYRVYGRLDPRAPYGNAPDEHLARIPVGLTGLLLDQQFGLLTHAPVYLLALAGLITLWRRRPRLAIELVAMATPYVLAVAGFHMWWAGHSSPARFLVPVLLPLALPVAAWWHRHDSRAPRAAALVALLGSLALTSVLAYWDRGGLVYNVRDGYALWLDRVAPAVNLQRALPSLFQGGVAAAWTLGAAWMLVGCAAWWALGRAARRIAPAGAWVLASGLVLCAALVGATTVGWAITGGPSEEAGASALRMAGRQCQPHHGPVITLNRTEPPAVGLTIADASRRPAAEAGPVWMGNDVPPGRYRVELRSGLSASGLLAIALGKSDAVFDRCAFADVRPGPTDCVIDLPAGAASLWVQPERGPRRPFVALALVLDAPGDPDACDLRAQRAIASSGKVLFVVGGTVFAEAAGGWVGGGGRGQFVGPAADLPLPLRLRNGVRPNTVEISSGRWREEWIAGPSETRDIDVPRGSDRGPLSLTIASADGFRPADVDPSSRDVRRLGVWVELR